MKIEYNVETDRETGKQMIVAQFVMKITTIKPQCYAGKLEFLEGITHPFCAYSLNVE
jgi:hypothetical protein